MNWYTADTHFDHHNIIKYCKRPFDNVHEMNKYIIDEWNSTVDYDDIVFHLGDFASPRCRDPRKYLEKLKGTIIFVKGNHDNKNLLSHMPFWTHEIEAKIGDWKCLLRHKPFYPKNMRGQNDKHKDHQNTPNANKYDFIISGHIHEKRLWSGRSLNVGIDQFGCLVDEDTLMRLLTEREAGCFKNSIVLKGNSWREPDEKEKEEMH